VVGQAALDDALRARACLFEWGTGSRAERDALRERARALGAAVELRFLDASPGELWRRIESRDRERTRVRRALTRAETSKGGRHSSSLRMPKSSRSTTRRFR
jgi:predicted kinase